MDERFRPVAEVTADSQRRVHLARAGIPHGSRWTVYLGDDGTILLTPVMALPLADLRARGLLGVTLQPDPPEHGDQ